ncbi:MAG: sulfatase [Armatimonadota bacterium]|nr:MAG: sulfatase [Armatimonadota bacterium]
MICCVDAARADHVGCYGYGRPTTPEIDALATEGVRFANAVTDATYTLAAVASLFTGQYPDTHGASVVRMRIPLGLTTLPEACRAAGMRTGVLSASGNVIKPHGFGDGVDDFVRVYTGNPEEGRVPDLQRAWREWLAGVGDERFFMYVHIMPPHHPYEQSGQFQGTFDPDYAGTLGPTSEILFKLDAGEMRASERDLRHIVAMYDEALRYADWAVGTLVGDLRERGVLDNTILVVFSDHGEAFGEHGRFLHSSTVYNELTHILLAARLPSRAKAAGRTVTGFAQLSDIAPTLASLAGLELPAEQVQGFDLAPEMFGGRAVRPAAFSRCLREPKLLWSAEVAGAKGIFDDTGDLIELYDVSEDPGEEKNVMRERRDLAQRVAAVWRAWAARQAHLGAAGEAPTRREKLDKDTREWLRSLGYLR